MRRIAVPQQKLQLVDGQNADTIRALIRPPLKPPLGQTLLAKPEPLAVIHQRLDLCRSMIPKYKNAARKRVRSQNMPADPRQSVNPFAEIHRLDGQQNPHLRRDLDHPRPQNVSINSRG